VTPAAWLKLSLSLPETTAGSHMGHGDVRVAGKIFSSPADRPSPGKTGGAAYLKLTPDQQKMLCEAEPEMFAPVKGGWGIKGATWIYVEKADAKTAKSALWMAWRNAASKTLLKQHPPAGSV
jgi:hypothetical protein